MRALRPRLAFLLSGAGILAGAALLLETSCSSDDANDDAGSAFGDAGAEAEVGPEKPPLGFNPNDAGPLQGDAAPQPACVMQEAAAVPGTRPVDIVFAIDNSESMSEEIGEVENQINDNFASIIEASGTDYHVIMLSEHGAHHPGATVQRICVKAPLSGTTCNPIPEKPVDTAKFMHHDVTVDSTNALCTILDSMFSVDKNGAHQGGWATFLRPNAFKVITVISDDRVNTTCRQKTFDDKFDDPVSGTNAAGLWESTLLALNPTFGTAAKRNYVFHSIVGLSGFDPIDTSKPYPPEAPIVTTQCTPGSVAPATGYQALSKLTGGLRFPTCGLNFTAIFQAMARGVIDKAAIECDYAFPANPPGAKIDPSTAVVRYTSGATEKDFTQAASLAACAANEFYIDGDRIKLCPDTCNSVQGDADAKVKVLFSCFPKDVQ